MKLPHARWRGFTLVELMITVVVIGVLAAIAYPSFIEQVRKGRRAEAFDALVLLQQEQERYRNNHRSYASSLDDLGLTRTSSTGAYTLAISDASASGYILTATASSSGKQASDLSCQRLKVELQRGQTTRSATNQAGTSSTSTCWPQ